MFVKRSEDKVINLDGANQNSSAALNAKLRSCSNAQHFTKHR